MESIVEHVRPVVRPLFATASSNEGDSPEPASGAPANGTPFASVAEPSNKMFPLVLTLPETICAIAASTGFGGFPSSVKNCERLAAVVVPVLVHVLGAGLSIKPG